MRTDRRRWLAPLVAALLLLAGATPGPSAGASAGRPITSAAHDRPGPDDAIHSGPADRLERGTIAERAPVDAVAPTDTNRHHALSAGTDVRRAAPAAARRLAPLQPRAPPGAGSPFPS
jgi:hypothetical protein